MCQWKSCRGVGIEAVVLASLAIAAGTAAAEPGGRPAKVLVASPTARAEEFVPVSFGQV